MSPPEFGVRDANANTRRFFSCFKISSTRLLALQAAERLTNPMTLTENLLLPKNTSSTSTKSVSPLRAEIQHWRGHKQKCRSEYIKCQNTLFQVKNIGEGGLVQTLPLVGRSNPSPHTASPPRPIKTSGSASASTEIQPDLRHRVDYIR